MRNRMTRLEISIYILSTAMTLLVASCSPAPDSEAHAVIAPHPADSLHAAPIPLEGEAKLRALWDEAKAERDASSGKEIEERAIERFLQEARLQKNRDMEAEALLMLLLCYNNYGDRERFLAMSEETGEFYLEWGYMEHYWEYVFLKTNLLHTSSDQKKVIELTGELYDRARSTNDIYGLAITSCRMGTAYQVAGKNEAAREAFLEAWSYVRQVKDPLKRAKLVYYCGQALVIEFNRIGNHSRSLEILQEWSHNIEESRAWAARTGTGMFTVDISQIHCDMFRAETYAYTGDYPMAEEYLARVTAVVDGYPLLVNNYYLHIRHNIHKQKGEHEESLAVTTRLKDYYAENGELYMYNQMAVEVRESLKALGRYKEAVSTGDEIIALSDSLYGAEHLRQLNELNTIYEVDKLKAQRQRQAIIIVSVSVGCLLLAVIIAIYVLYSRNLKRKTDSLYNRIQEMTRVEREASRILELIPEGELSREMKLFRELAGVMNSEKLFLDPDLDRRSVAGRLGTNEKYLANAIHEGAAGATFTNYISGLRLAHSLDLLTRNPDMTLEAVAEQSGHGSYSPFFKAFVKNYGMSPSEYRRLFSARSA